MAYDSTDFVVTEVPVPVRDPKSITDPRERVAYLRDFLRELPPSRFDMTKWASCPLKPNSHEFILTDCGTFACIGGWTNTFWPEPWNLWDQELAARTLGLSDAIAQSLFFGEGVARDTTPAQAANVLDHYLATGLIDWSVA